MLQAILALPRWKKRAIALGFDLCAIPFSIWLAFSLRLGEFYVPGFRTGLLIAVAPVIAIPIFIRMGLYRAIIRYISFMAMWTILKAVTLYILIWSTAIVFTSTLPGLVPRSVPIIAWLVALLLIGGSRASARWWLTGQLVVSARSNTKNVTIYGAGEAGVQVIGALSAGYKYRPVAFIDDNPALHGSLIQGLRVHPQAHLNELIEKYDVQEVFLALPSSSRSERNRVITSLEPYKLHVRTLPALEDLASGSVQIQDIREVGVRDLLGRDAVEPIAPLLQANIKDKVVMVTGAGGSIGSELSRQILKIGPAILILFDRSEHDLYQIEKDLLKMMHNLQINQQKVRVISILGSVLSLRRLQSICETYEVNTIYHAAAYKHVPMIERNPLEAVNNNIFGTYNVARAAIDKNVDSMVLISTDKAVRPTSIMGATKRFAEMVLQALADNHESGIKFSIVRFGNVLGSSGSVIPLFREQIKLGGPVTVTDPNIIRYFMTIPEAAQLVIQAGAMGTQGDVFVLDMGQPVKILDMARRLIHLSGLEVKDDSNPNGDIEIVFTGLRPGEKLYEELLIGENVESTSHPLIMSAAEKGLPITEIARYLEELKAGLEENDVSRCRQLLIDAIDEFNPQSDDFDHIRMHRRARDIAESQNVIPLNPARSSDQ